MNKKGLSLVELLAVLVLIGLILLVVIPNVTKLFNKSSSEKYDYYEDIAKNAFELYRKDNTIISGSSELYPSCVKLSTLLSSEYIKEFTEEECDYANSFVIYESSRTLTYLNCDKYNTDITRTNPPLNCN